MKRSETSAPPRRASRSLAAAAFTGATVLNYLAWLAWDQARTVNPVTGRETGPYDAWQVVGAGAVLLLLALTAGWRKHLVMGIVVIPTAFTACWVIDSATENTPDANLWPIGAAFVGAGSLLGTIVFAAAGLVIRLWRERLNQSTG